MGGNTMTQKEHIVKSLIHNYRSEEKSIVEQLFFKANHNVTIGTYREQVWQELFENIVPKKFVVEQSVFIIDSEGQISSEVDLAILDVMYTPYIFKKGQLKFIPIEAVAVAIQCKSISRTKFKELKLWTESIKALKTVPTGIARMATMISQGGSSTQKSTRPLLVYCYLGESKQATNEELFDISIRANQEKGQLEVSIKPTFNQLNDVHQELNFYKVQRSENNKKLDGQTLEDYRVKAKENEVSLLSLNFILNQALMLLNNPMLFPHKAYVEMFNKERV